MIRDQKMKCKDAKKDLQPSSTEVRGETAQSNANWMHGRDDDLDKKKARRLSMTTANLERCPWQDRRKFKKNTAETFCSVNNRVP